MNTWTNFRTLALPLLAAGIFAGCSGEHEAFFSGGPGTPVARAASRQPDAAVREPVRVESVAQRTLAETVEPIGTVRARVQSVLSSRIVAAVVGVHVREGQRVRAGEVVVTLDDRDLATDLRRAEAGVREARQALEETERGLAASARAIEGARAQQELAATTLRRYASLLDREIIARQQHDEVATQARAATAELGRLQETHAALLAKREQALARIEQAEADLARAGVAGGYARVLAPADGIVVSKTVDVGNLAAPGVALVTIESERYRLEATVQESDIRHVRPGGHATVSIDALGIERTGTVEEIVPAADAASRTFLVRIDVGADSRLRSGLYGRARFVVGERRALLVPRTAVVERGQLQTVFVVDGGDVAHLRLVRTGKTAGDTVELLSGLAGGERLVVEGAERLVDGAPVEPRA